MTDARGYDPFLSRWDHLPPGARTLVNQCEERLREIAEQYSPPENATASQIAARSTPEGFALMRRRYYSECQPWIDIISHVAARYMPPIMVRVNDLAPGIKTMSPDTAE